MSYTYANPGELCSKDFTSEEWSELERAYNGPITQQAMRDKLAQRGMSNARPAPTVDSLKNTIRFLEAQRALSHKLVAEYDTEIAELAIERDALADGPERDRKTRIIATKVANREGPVAGVAYYNGLIRDASIELSRLTLSQHANAAE